jgi:hypothetical protein
MIPTRSRPDFTGVWRLNIEKSVFRGPKPRHMVVKLDHREPILIQQILYVDTSGLQHRLNFKYEIGGESTNQIGGARATSRTMWEGTELAIESWMQTPQRELHFKDYWSASDDAQSLTMAHRDDDLAGQIALLERVPQAEPTMFE